MEQEEAGSSCLNHLKFKFNWCFIYNQLGTIINQASQKLGLDLLPHLGPKEDSHQSGQGGSGGQRCTHWLTTAQRPVEAGAEGGG